MKSNETLTLDEARALEARIRALVESGHPEQALALGEPQIVSGSGHSRAIVLLALIPAYTSVGRAVDGLRAAAAARDEAKAENSRDGELDALLGIGLLMRTVGDHGSAIQALEEAESIARDLQDESRVGVVLRQMGVCCSLLGRHQQALSSLQEAAMIHAGDPLDREYLHTLLSLYNAHNRHATSLDPGDPERERDLVAHLERWRTLAENATRAGMGRMELMALGNLAITLHDCGRHREALDALEALLPRYREHGMTPNEAICLFEMGRALQSLGDLPSARVHYAEAIAIFDRTGSKGDLRDALDGIAHVDEALGNHRDALAALRRVRAIERETDDEAARRRITQRDLRIELAKLSNQWHRLASTDPLTGLANRRGLEQWFGNVHPRIECGDPLFVVLFDMDHFKAINDGFGHQVGDEVLRNAARLIHDNCRPSDLAVRYGGEEFLLALMDIGRDGAVDVAERLRASIEAYGWGSVAPALRVTISAGVASIDEVDNTTELLTLVDRRLYAAKHGGRNQVISRG